MANHYQYARADGQPDWRGGQENFQNVFEGAADALRFHKPGGFRIIEGMDEGPVRKLWESGDALQKRLDHSKEGTVLRLRAEKDGYDVLFRRHEVNDPKADQLIAAMARRVGQPYVWGGMDCSGLVMSAVYAVTGILLPHMASAIRDDSRIKSISREQAKKGDFLFIDRDSYGKEHHIATLLDKDNAQHPGGWVVWDTEPSNAGSPGGWPQPYLGTGVRIRPAFGGYYCADISSYGRLPAINGA
jgi:hypothetical protein